MKVVIATSNQGKLKEFETLLAPLNWQFYSLQDLGINSPIEDGATFYENALIKAKHAATISGYPAIADDSGLCVDFLNGEPGIKSARYAGENSSDAENNIKLLESLENEKSALKEELKVFEDNFLTKKKLAEDEINKISQEKDMIEKTINVIKNLKSF